MDSSQIPLGRLTRIDARTVWRNEALDFTPWIKENIETLSDALGMELELPAIEVPVGDFSCDVVAQEVGTGHRVIIENQLEPTNHGHLGQLLTYAAGLDARGVVWISPQFRAEHRQAIDWLNANTVADLYFFGVEIELLQIGVSPYAPHFNVVALPNDWQKTLKARTETAVSEQGLAYQQFFAEFLVMYKEAFPSQRTNNNAYPTNWLTIASAGRSGFRYAAAFDRRNRLRVELYIDRGEREANKDAFDQLERQRDAIEREIGLELDWDRLDSKRAVRISAFHDGRVSDPEPLRLKLLGWAVATVNSFRRTFGPRIRQLPLS